MVLWFTSLLLMKYSRLGLGELDVRLLGLRPFLPRAKRLLQPGLHRLGIEVSGDAEDDVVGIDILLVPVQQVLTRDRRNCGVLGNSRVGVVFAVRDNAAFAMDDGLYVIVAA